MIRFLTTILVVAFPMFIQETIIPSPSRSAPRAIYYMTNVGSNAIVAIPVVRNGTLATAITKTLTDGAGGADVNPITGQPSSPDALASAGTVQVVGQNLFAVNPGSNTLSMFYIDRKDPTHLTLLGKPQNTKGEFPISVAISPKHRLACVANTGAISGISCAFYSPYGLEPFDTLRNFGLNQTTPPVGLNNTISHTFFDNAQQVLYTTVKGLVPTNPTGYLSAFSIAGGRLSNNNIHSSPNGTQVLFGTANIPNDLATDGSDHHHHHHHHEKLILAADGSFGAEIISINAQLQGSTRARIEIPGNKETCWATFSPTTGTGFMADGGFNQITEIDVHVGTVVTQLRPSTNNIGMNDIAAVGDWVYALSPNKNGQSNAVTVFDVSGGRGSIKEMQTFLPGGSDNFAAGLGWIM